MPKHLIAEDVVPLAGTFTADALVRGEPSLPAEFAWPGGAKQGEPCEWLPVQRVLRTWRATKDDRGDTYLKRHYFEFETSLGRRAVVYFERQARRGESRWRLYTLETR